ncbi:Asparagine synthetase [glutamine-hydrolyzing] 1 [Aquisphaera giovannonii]|uniref:asparagine synthase (glutamine-hydrolyzing) n=1 Tax=Aquisphaera giovannonii TaxID=406548 RepID=A0A5B9VUL0_9BACT|nr:asparagine synthase (glutamine-hydrolyzing) [Aquisphaera giovannonii]QEH31962.1 Asparagine synthetase [glutamine-hydrolyzing] 1 [Aquisphaera giovannonii]
MCGICGAAWGDPRDALDGDRLASMMDRIVHRGPDDAGTYRDGHAALGFRRLSIIDLAGGHQPLSNEDGSVWVAFNGEIYNYQALRHRLEARGHTLRSSGDTETLVHLYEDEGTGLFGLLRGMFAMAIWDAPRRTLILGRDRLGQKPLVYRHDGRRLVFASELKALLALPEADCPRAVDPRSLDEYLTYGYVPQPRTILRGVHKLPPGHFATWHDGVLKVEPYWQPDWNLERRRPAGEDAEALRETLTDAVREQMVADVPLGAFLSGGIDSTIIAGLMQRASGRPVKTFAIGFPDAAYDETRYAELAAQRLGTEHHTFMVEPKAWETLPALARQFDEPFADSSALPTWHVARETRREVTVALTGDAGDELFGGYDRYRALALTELFHRLPATPRRWIGKTMRRVLPRSGRSKSRLRALERLFERINDPAGARYLGWMVTFDEPSRLRLYSDAQLDLLAEASAHADDGGPGDPAGILAESCARAGKRDTVTQAMVGDILTYLPGDLLFKVDMASMAHSLECRGPFLDHRVVELAAAMPLDRKLRVRPGRSKVVLKRAFADLLPAEIAGRRKMGFGVPVGRWFKHELKDELQGILLDRSSLDRGLFRPEAIRSLVAEHVEGRREHGHRLWALLMLELWFRNYGG